MNYPYFLTKLEHQQTSKCKFDKLHLFLEIRHSCHNILFQSIQKRRYTSFNKFTNF